MQIGLVISRGGDDLLIEPFSGRRLTVGRHFSNDVTLPDPTVSRRHFEIRRSAGDDGDSYELLSLSEAVSPSEVSSTRPLTVGERVRCGSFDLRLEPFDRDAASVSTAGSGRGGTAVLDREGENESLAVRCRVGGKLIRRALEGDSFTVGARDGNDLVIEGDDFVSGFHLRLLRRADGWWASDLGSTNGTLLNGTPVVEARLSVGSVVTVGKTEIEVVSDAAGAGERVAGIVWADESMGRLLEKVRAVAATDEPVLIQGESGTGKELLARAVHELSARSAREMFVLNCSAVSQELFESELFGHEKGAFTGSAGAKRGLFEDAHRSSIFLDEIGDMSIQLQPKLLRAIEYGEVRRVGANRPVRVDVRVISATNQDLRARVREGAFRRDLYYRLRGFVLEVPLLRERRADILPLAEHFLRAMSMAVGRPRRLSDAARARLERHDWPGNVRELRQVVRNAAILARGETVGEGDIEFADEDLTAAATSGAASTGRIAGGVGERTGRVVPGGPGTSEIPDSLGSPEGSKRSGPGDRSEVLPSRKGDIIRALSEHGWNKTKAAEALGIARSTLRRRMARYGLDEE